MTTDADTSPNQVTRRAFAAGLAAAGFGQTAARDRPNVLFILADQWRWSAFQHAGDPNVRTPNFDRLAAQGALFTRTYAANPVCTPNRSSILTGRFPHQHRMTINSIMLPPSERCLAEPFEQAGYATHYVGKWHMDGPDKPGFVPRGWRRRGFRTFEGFNRGHRYPTGAQYFSDDGKLIEPDEYEPHYQASLAMDFMRRQREIPFFCFLSWGPPHMPYRPPKEWARHDPKKLIWRPNVPATDRADTQAARDLAGYYGLCESLDHELGRVLEFLEQSKLAEKTLVVFTSDHGDMHHSHGLLHKSKPEEESLHIPLSMRWPGRIRADQKIETLASTVDLMPTISSLCGFKPPRPVAGRNLSSAVLGGAAPKVESVYAEGSMRVGEPGFIVEADDPANQTGTGGGREWRALVTQTHKLVMRAPGEVAALFDLERDPYEMKNLAAESQAKALRQKLLGELQDWGRRTGDPFPQVSPHAKKRYSDDEAAQARGGA